MEGSRRSIPYHAASRNSHDKLWSAGALACGTAIGLWREHPQSTNVTPSTATCHPEPQHKANGPLHPQPGAQVRELLRCSKRVTEIIYGQTCGADSSASQQRGQRIEAVIAVRLGIAGLGFEVDPNIEIFDGRDNSLREVKSECMSDKFNQKDVEDLLVACHRCCCICHRFCGVKMEIDHIIPKERSGPSTSENGIPVCFECHADIHSYNDKHPRGRKFYPDELRKHKAQWLDMCKTMTVFTPKLSESVGPLQSLIDELEFNSVVANTPHEAQGCPFLDHQFLRAIREGAVALLRDDLKGSIVNAYLAIGRANQHILAAAAQPPGPEPWATALNRASKSIIAARTPIGEAHQQLLKFLGSED